MAVDSHIHHSWPSNALPDWAPGLLWKQEEKKQADAMTILMNK